MVSQSLGHPLTPPSVDANALFGPSKFTARQQAENPDKPMTRVVKDVLPVGQFNIGGSRTTSMWNVDHATLDGRDRIQEGRGHAVGRNRDSPHGPAE